jgi:hypothetical protein
VTEDGYALGYASAALRGDKEVVLAAVAQNGLALQSAQPFLQVNFTGLTHTLDQL